MVEEELTAHDEEWGVMRSPQKEEETRAVVKTTAGAAIERVNSTAHRELVGEDDAGEDRKNGRSEPPANRVAQKVNLLSRFLIGPEADTAQ